MKCHIIVFWTINLNQHTWITVGPLIGEHYVSRYYGTIDIPEAGTYEFCAHANAGYHYVGMDMVKQGGTKHPGPYGQTLIGFDAGKYSKRRRSNVAVIIVRIVFISSFLFYCLL